MTENVLIHITFTYDDLESLAEGVNTPLPLAIERANGWANSIRDTAVTLINEQLSNVIEFDAP